MPKKEETLEDIAQEAAGKLDGCIDKTIILDAIHKARAPIRRELRKLTEEARIIRPKADAYDRVCKALRIQGDILGYIKLLKK